MYVAPFVTWLYVNIISFSAGASGGLSIVAQAVSSRNPQARENVVRRG